MAIITKLEGSVTDENLMKLGELKIHIKASDNFTLGYQLYDAHEYTARIVGDGNFFTDSSFSQSAGKTITKTSFATYVSAGEYDIVFTGKYDVLQVMFNNVINTGTMVDAEDFNFAGNFRTFSLKYCTVRNLEKLKFENITTLNIDHCSSNFDVDLLDGTTNLTNVAFSYESGVTGNITSLAGNINATNLSVYQTSVTGTYADLGDALFANGKHSGDVDVYDKTTYKKLRFSSSGWTVIS